MNLKSINIQKCQKIKLHGTLTTKELKKQSTRPTRPVRWEDGENPWQGGGPCGHGWLKEPQARQWTVQAGLAEWETETQSRLWTMAGVAGGGRNSQSHSRELVGKWGNNQAGELHFSLSGPSPTASAAAQQGGLPCPGEYLRLRPLTT